MLWASLVLDELASGNHRRGRAGATLGDVYGAYRCATNSGGGWGPGHTGNVGSGAGAGSIGGGVAASINPPGRGG